MNLATIPGPPGRPLVGNMGDIDAEHPMQSLCSLTDTYGPIWKFRLGGEERVVIGSQALMNEVCNEDRFSKIIAAALKQARNGVHDGLGTAYSSQETNWGIAHRTLAPHFGPLAIRSMFDEMHDIASQLVMKWTRQGPGSAIQVTDDFTRLTLDTIALCAMDYRFNSYYSERLHPFVQAMSRFLKVSGDRARRVAVSQPFHVLENHEYWGNIELLRETSRAIVNARKEHPSDKKDMLGEMLHGVDPETGKPMTDESIIDNMITLLVAGHETTSGLLSFTFYHLLTHPAAYAEAQKEVDAVVGGGPITVDHLASLPYLNAVFRESLRLTPPIPTIMLTNKEDTVLGGRHYIKAGTPIIALIAAVHRDPSVYGSDADEFRPERMLDGEFARRNKQYPNCWKPFGNGVRACIGRSLAWQQALLAVTMILQNFELSMDNPSYQLKIKQTLTVKPEGFHMRARLRQHGASATMRTLASRPAAPSVPNPAPAIARQAAGTPMNIYYGSNTGTCKQLAHQLAGHAAEHGFRADVVDTLNSAADGLPADRPTVVIAASYNGQPADNAARFFAWVHTLKGTELANVAYAVYGCGNRDWTDTFHKIPRELDSVLEQRGGTRLVEMGTSDVARGCVASDLETWADDVFWPAMRERYGAGREPEGGLGDETAKAQGDVKEKGLGDAEKKELGEKELKEESALQVTISSPRSSALGRDLSSARVRKSIVLPGAGSTSKRHMEVELPQGMTYAAGDYVDILPCNPKDVVCRALRKFGIAGDSVMTLYSGRPTPLPTNTPIAATEAFGAYVELTQPATQRAVQALQDATHDQATKTKLARLAEEAYDEEIAIGRLSVLDLLERFPTVRISPGAFLSMHTRMRTRPYCISSSPLWNDRVVTLTYSVASQPVAGGQKHPVGVGSTYLDSLLAGDELSVRVRKSPLEASRLPEDVENVRLVMIAAGTGIAPFHGFIQERAAQSAAGRSLAPALLFYGCRSPADVPYPAALERWQQLGAVSLRYAFSDTPEGSHGCRYVQDRILYHKADIVKSLEAGARLAVCVPECAVSDVRQTLAGIAEEALFKKEGGFAGRAAAEDWLQGVWHNWESH